jgi:hypothetical protein
MIMMSKLFTLSSLVALAFTNSADAALVATAVSSTSETNYAPSSVDLLHGLTPTTTGASFSGDTNALNDGVSISGDLTATGGNMYLNNANPGTVTMTIDLTGSVTGYDLFSIVSDAGWIANAQFHASQTYQVLVSLVGSSDYNPLVLTTGAVSDGNVSYDPFIGGGPGYTRVVITNNSGSAIASGVDGIRFIMTNSPLNNIENDTVYREIDVFGTASVPEPSAVLLGGLSVLALLRRRR